jgi:hypothetical protein
MVGYEEMCLDEYFSDKTLIIYEIESHGANLDIRIEGPDESELYSQVKITGFNFLEIND